MFFRGFVTDRSRNNSNIFSICYQLSNSLDNVDERGRNITCKRTLTSLLVLIKNQI